MIFWGMFYCSQSQGDLVLYASYMHVLYIYIFQLNQIYIYMFIYNPN